MKFWFLFSLILISACATHTRNVVREGTSILRGGTDGKTVWKEDLHFERKSWFREMVLYFDIWYTQVPKSSPFYSWLSDGEKRQLDNCRQSYWALVYSLDNDRISHSMFREMLKKQEIEEIKLTQAETHIRVHPEFDAKSLNAYKFVAFCDKKLVRSSPVVLSVPGFLDSKL